MGKVLKWLAIAAGFLAGAVGLLYAIAWRQSEAAMAQTFLVQDPPIVFAGDDAEGARGAHLYAVLGCVDCHGTAAAGKLLFDAGLMGRVAGSNLTPSALGARYNADTMAAAIRHGVLPRPGPGGPAGVGHAAGDPLGAQSHPARQWPAGLDRNRFHPGDA